jgi:3-deoxy-D-manno-octulosonic acid kinase
VPKPVAARYRRRGLLYRCDLITQRIAGALPLSALLASGTLPAQRWHTVGAAVARLHRAGVDHADLNAHNILLDTKGVVSVIDFDRSRLRAQGAWAARNLERLKRSLAKIGHFSEDAWEWFMAGYGEA